MRGTVCYEARIPWSSTLTAWNKGENKIAIGTCSAWALTRLSLSNEMLEEVVMSFPITTLMVKMSNFLFERSDCFQTNQGLIQG